MGLLERFRQDLDILKMPVVSIPGETLVLPGRQHDLDSFPEARMTFLWRHAERLELRRVESPASPPVDPTAGEDVEQRHLFGQAQRMIKGRQGDAHTNTQMLRLAGHMHAHQMHRGTDTIMRK